MADFNKVGLLIFSNDNKEILVTVKNHFTSDYLLPGGRIEEGESDEDCLVREIKEELACELNRNSLVFIGEYEDVAAGDASKKVSIKLYQGQVFGEPVPSSEIIEVHKISREDIANAKVSPIIRNKILPDLIERGILK